MEVSDENDQNDEALEAAVIRDVLSGKRDEFRHLVDRHKERVFAMIMRQVGDRQVARELAQEVFVRAYVGLRRFRGDATFSTWLTRIALNVSSSYFTSRRFKDQKRFASLDEQIAEQHIAPPGEEVFTDEAIAQLQHSLTALKQIYRDVIVLCIFERKSYEETAEILQIPIGTVSSRMNKAFGLLRANYFQD